MVNLGVSIIAVSILQKSVLLLQRNILLTYEFVLPVDNVIHVLYVSTVLKRVSIFEALIESGCMEFFRTRDIKRWIIEERVSGAALTVVEAPKPMEVITILSSLMFLSAMLAVASIIFAVEICRGGPTGGSRALKGAHPSKHVETSRYKKTSTSQG